MSIASEIERIKTNISNAYEALEEKGAILPSQYQEVEYIESTGTQYIDTGVIGNQSTSIEIKAQIKSRLFLFGSRKSLSQNAYGIAINTTSQFRSDYGSSNLMYDVDLSDVCIIKKDKNKTYFNDILALTHTTQTFQCPGNIYLFGVNNNGTVVHGSHSIYFCKIYDDGTLIRDFIPCYRKSDSEAGLYDLVNGVFYTNSGTGQFTIGEEVDKNSNNLSKFIDRLEVL